MIRATTMAPVTTTRIDLSACAVRDGREHTVTRVTISALIIHVVSIHVFVPQLGNLSKLRRILNDFLLDCTHERTFQKRSVS